MVREAGLEPARPYWTLEPESSESANSTTRAYLADRTSEKMVRVTGLEPVRQLTHAPQTCLSTSSSTLASAVLLRTTSEDYYSHSSPICQPQISKISKFFSGLFRGRFSRIRRAPARNRAPGRLSERKAAKSEEPVAKCGRIC